MSRDVLTRPAPLADHRLAYGALPLQFGDLRLPSRQPGTQPGSLAPLLVFFHGGWWQSEYDLTYAGHLCEALRRAGVATWSVEYRRVGDAGGGWPGTMQDAAAGFDFVHELALRFPVDAQRVVCAGHSAGGQLAFLQAGRHHIPHSSMLATPPPTVPVHALVALAGAVDLRLVVELGGFFTFTEGAPAVHALMGGTEAQFPDRYRAADPGNLLPLSVPQTLIQGTMDTQIPPSLPTHWAELARRQGDTVSVDMLAGADHFDVVDPQSSVWPRVQAALLAAFQ